MPVFTSSIEVTADYPTIKPSLNLNFARSRSLDPRITFTRASTATYVGRDGLIKTAGEDEARFDHDPDTLESLGLLLEESRTNYLGNSEMLANWNFGVAGDAFTASSGSQLSTNPDGSSPAYHYVPSSTAGLHRFNRPVTVPTLDTNYVVSLFVKRVTAGSVSNLNRFVELEVTGAFGANTPGTGQSGVTGGSSVTFDMENLVIETQTNNSDGYVGDAKIEPYPNGWYRLSYVFNPGIGTQFTGYVWWGHCSALADDTNETGNDNPSFYFWGASVENGSFISSHIPTPANSSVTRAADFATILGESFNSFFNPYESTLYASVVSNGTSNGGIIGIDRTDGVTYIDPIYTGSTITFYGSGGPGNKPRSGDGRDKLIQTWNDTGDTQSFTANGATPSSYTFTSAIAPDKLSIGRYSYAGGNFFNGRISEVRYYGKALPDAQLQLLTS